MSQLSLKIANQVMRVEHHLCPHYCGVVNRRRVIAFLFLSLIEILVIPCHLVMFSILREPWGLSLAIIHTFIFMGGQYLTWKQKIHFDTAISFFYLLIFAKLALDCVFCPLFGAPNDHVSVVGNVFIMFVLAITAMSQMLKKTALVISLGVVPVLLVYYLTHPIADALFAIKAFFVGFMMIGYVATYNMKAMTKGLRQPSELTKEERKALEMLAALKDMNYDKSGNLMERLSPEMRQRIVKHASEHIRKEEIEKAAWDQICGELTNSEKEICKLVLQGRSLKEICIELNKSESNITSQRSHIRRKLNLDRKEDLRRTLELRISEIRAKSMAEQV